MTDSKAPAAFDIGIIAAMQIELDGIAAKLEDIKKETVRNIQFLCGTLYGKKIVCAVCGVGKVFAAMCAQTMILKYSPACIVNTGVAGGLAEGLRVLDVVAADSVVQYVDVEAPIQHSSFFISLALCPNSAACELKCSAPIFPSRFSARPTASVTPSA